MVTWHWTRKMGSYKTEDGFTINIYSGNCLGVSIYEYTDSETGKEMFNLHGYWVDIYHLKRCLGLINTPWLVTKYKKQNIYKGTTHWRLNTYFGTDIYNIAKALTKAGIKVSLYYKKPKDK